MKTPAPLNIIIFKYFELKGGGGGGGGHFQTKGGGAVQNMMVDVFWPHLVH